MSTSQLNTLIKLGGSFCDNSGFAI